MKLKVGDWVWIKPEFYDQVFYGQRNPATGTFFLVVKTHRLSLFPVRIACNGDILLCQEREVGGSLNETIREVLDEP